MPREFQYYSVNPWEVLQDDVVEIAGRSLVIDCIESTYTRDREQFTAGVDAKVMSDSYSKQLISNLVFTFRTRTGETFSVPGHEFLQVKRFAVPGKRGEAGGWRQQSFGDGSSETDARRDREHAEGVRYRSGLPTTEVGSSETDNDREPFPY